MRRGVLFVHDNFPGQFRDLAELLVSRGVPCAAIGGPPAPGVMGVRIARCPLPRGSTPDVFRLAVRPEADLIRAQAAYNGACALRQDGFDAAVMIGHPGWGQTLFINDVWPEVKQALFAEYFYHGWDSDIDFDPEFGEPEVETRLTAKAKSAIMALAYSQADAIVAPTAFQASRLPPVFRDRARIVHEGIDTDAITPGPAQPFTLPDGRVIAPGTPVITHVNNKLEPLRGLHVFVRALPKLLDAVPDAQVLIAGRPESRAYGGDAPDGMTWKDYSMRGVEDRLDPARVHFLGHVPHDQMLAMLRLSTAHVYYTYPFVLSWSLVEAMASGCYVIGSDTAPMHDAIRHGVNGRLLPFFDVDALSEAMIAACRDPRAQAPLRAAARETAVAKFSRRRGRHGWLEVIRDLGFEVPPES